MSVTQKNKGVVLMGDPLVNEDDKAAGVITPGYLVDFNGGGDLVAHATAAGMAARDFALERSELGKTNDPAFAGYAGSVNYAIGDQVKVGAFSQGMRLHAWIASGQNITKGNFLESAGDGTLRVYGSGVRLCRALETSGAVTVLTQLRVEVV